jgi:quinoprotein glucose dehydrogenase
MTGKWLRAKVVVTFFILGSCNSRDTSSVNWEAYKADASSSGYSSLTSINKRNVHQLTQAWVFEPRDARERSRPSRGESNPIVIDGVMYTTSAMHHVYALDAATGKQLWSFNPYEVGGESAEKRGRGVTYWEEGDDKRILFTAGDKLYALDARTGKQITSFGENGIVNLNYGMRGDPKQIMITPTSPGIIFEDLIIIGTQIPDSNIFGAEPGYERAYNVKTGKLVWVFHTIPQPGEPGYETWPPDAWKYTGGANDWGGMSLDKKRGMVFLALGSPTYDYYGGARKGKNLFGNCVVALNARTGKLIWYYQTVHHDLWDYDLPAPPNLVTIERDGKKIDAVAQVSKTGFLYVLDREKGTPIFPIEERHVPASDVPGEEAWPTQPFPVKPAPYSRQLITEDDLSDFSGNKDSLIRYFKSLRYEGMFTPPSFKGSITFPGSTGGAEWGGAAYDFSTSVLYVKSNDRPELGTLKKRELDKSRQSDYISGEVLYNSYCASCHGDKRQGQDIYPSLLNLEKRMKREDALEQIKYGSGKMPPFESVIKGNEDAIIAYLFQLKDKSATNKLDTSKQVLVLDKNETPYLNVSAYRGFQDAEGHSAIRPPWGTLNAIDLNTGDYLWKVPVGNYPQLQQKGGPLTGMGSSPGPVVTAGGLVFIGGTADKKFSAFDKDTGKLLWEVTLPAASSSNPSTYSVKGRQYVAVSVGGTEQNPAGSVMVFALPGSSSQ